MTMPSPDLRRGSAAKAFVHPHLTLVALCVSPLRKSHANMLCIVRAHRGAPTTPNNHNDKSDARNELDLKSKDTPASAASASPGDPQCRRALSLPSSWGLYRVDKCDLPGSRGRWWGSTRRGVAQKGCFPDNVERAADCILSSDDSVRVIQ